MLLELMVGDAYGAGFEYASLSELLQACINYTGDVDTVATLALAAAACSTEVENDLPQHLIETIVYLSIRISALFGHIHRTAQ